MRISRSLMRLLLVCAALLFPIPVIAQLSQQGPKLVGTGSVGLTNQGVSAALSSDGNIAIIGGNQDFGGVGAAWVWTRSGGAWTQQGDKLSGLGHDQGASVAISADGQTAIIGAPGDSNFVRVAGGATVWIRSGGIWSQQGIPLVGSGASGGADQGRSVSLSADGNTAIVGGYRDNDETGAVWVWTRSGGVWTQQGNKLVGSNGPLARQGRSVCLSADGNTAIVGGYQDNGNTGAAWIWTRSGGVWTQQGDKLVGSGVVAISGQGFSVSLSADGNTALVGGPGDNSGSGAVWIWTRSGGVWTQQGNKLTGSGSAGAAAQGNSVSLSADGNTAVVGGPNDNGSNGAAWVWTRTGGVWTQLGNKLVGSGAVPGGGFNPGQGIGVAISADGNTAIVGGYRDNGGFSGAAWVFVRAPLTTIDPALLPIASVWAVIALAGMLALLGATRMRA